MQHNKRKDQLEGLPRGPVDRMFEPLARFMHIESASGVVLVIATLFALIAANSPLADAFLKFWKIQLGFEFGSFRFIHSLQHWINDLLMAIFFFVIGLEVKRELVSGELQSFQKAALPIAAAIGGMVVPAAVYLFFQAGEVASDGWGIPMATDIAFVVGIMALMGTRIPAGLRVFLLSLAIADDIGAILVIAIGYTEQISLTALAISFALIFFFRLLQRMSVINTSVYIVLAVLIWFGFHESGIHATIAGVILGLMTPAGKWMKRNRLLRMTEDMLLVLRGEDRLSPEEKMRGLRNMEIAAREGISPLDRFETGLHPWVSFLIMPLFALANAGLPLNMNYFTDQVALAVVAGLVIGKPLGIILFSSIAVKSGLASLPENVNWRHVIGGGCLAGIGFTMALFISGLALSGDSLGAAKFGVFTGSLISAISGVLILLAGAKQKFE